MFFQSVMHGRIRKSIAIAFEIQRRFVHNMVTVSIHFCSEDPYYRCHENEARSHELVATSVGATWYVREMRNEVSCLRQF